MSTALLRAAAERIAWDMDAATCEQVQRDLLSVAYSLDSLTSALIGIVADVDRPGGTVRTIRPESVMQARAALDSLDSPRARIAAKLNKESTP